MAKRIIEFYIATACLAAIVASLVLAPAFFRARRAAFYARGDARVALAGYRATGLMEDRAEFQKALAKEENAGLIYEAARDNMAFVGAVFVTHALGLLVSEFVFWRRRIGARGERARRRVRMTERVSGCYDCQCERMFPQGARPDVVCGRCPHIVARHDFFCGVVGCGRAAIPNSAGDRVLANGNITGLCEVHVASWSDSASSANVRPN